ncbi:MAG: hypothetical protein KDC98_03920 [Planctomycetes bacterium]|nr:hypothetical protein [Planctomycetota bacterium]
MPTTGNYYLRVHDSGLDEGGQYQLSLNVLVGQQPNQLASAWENLGQSVGIAGVCGVPTLYGTGDMALGSLVSMNLRDAEPNNLFLLVAGCARASFPVFTGILVPTSEIVFGAITDGDGKFTLLESSWPAFPPGYPLFVQAWGLDATSPDGVTASNAMLGIMP